MLSVEAGSVSEGIVSEEINYTVNDNNFTGYLAYDDTIKGKRPGILVMHEDKDADGDSWNQTMAFFKQLF